MSEAKKKQKPNSGSFTTGDPRISTLQKRAAEVAGVEVPWEAPVEAPVEDGSPVMYPAMRYVLRTSSGRSDTPEQAKVRRLHEADPVLFMKMYADLEKTQAPQTERLVTSEGSEVKLLEDAGSDKIEALIDKLLARMDEP